MAQLFYDTFNRANGPPGPDWTIDSGSPVIESNTLKCASTTLAHPTTQPTGADYVQRAWVIPPVSTSKTISFRLHAALDAQNYLAVTFLLTTTGFTVSFFKRIDGTLTALSATSLSRTWGSTADCMVAIVGDQLIAWVDGYLALSENVPDLPSNGLAQIASSTTYAFFDSYALYELSSTPLGITAVDNETTPPSYTLSLVNGGAPWTPGSPGAPTFQCAAGTITSQTVDDVDHATLIYEPPVLDAQTFILDYQNDWWYRLDLSTILNPGTGEGGGLTPTQAQQLENIDLWRQDYDNQTGEGGNNTLFVQLGAISLLLQSSWTGIGPGALQELLDAVLNSTEGLAAIKALVLATHDALDDMNPDGELTLNQLQNNIRGTNLPSIADVITAISNLSSGNGADLDSVLAELAAIRTANLWTLGHVKDWIDAIPEADVSEVLQELALIRTANLWTLGHVKDWIDAISVPDYSTELDALQDAVDAIPTNPVTSLQAVLDAIAAVRGSGSPDIAAVLTAISAIPTNPITSLSDVLTALTNLATSVSDKYTALMEAIGDIIAPDLQPTAPIWPGEANVTMGDPVTLDRTFSFTGACDGVIVAIATDPLSHGSYDWGAITQHPHAVYVTFKHDSGAYEDCQGSTFPSQCLCPKLAAHATGFIGRARAGVTGTATPWVINTP